MTTNRDRVDHCVCRHVDNRYSGPENVRYVDSFPVRSHIDTEGVKAFLCAAATEYDRVDHHVCRCVDHIDERTVEGTRGDRRVLQRPHNTDLRRFPDTSVGSISAT